MSKTKTNYNLPIHALKVTGCEAGRVRQFIELVDNDEYAVIEFIDELHKVKPFNMLDRLERQWVVGDRATLNFHCAEEAWTLYVKEFALYLRNCGTSKMCHEFINKMEGLNKVSSIKISKFRKRKQNEQPQEEKVPVLTGPERIAKAYEERHANDGVIKLPNTFLKNDDIVDDEPELLPQEDDDTPTFILDRVCTVKIDDVMMLIEHINGDRSRVPEGAISRLMYAIIKGLR